MDDVVAKIKESIKGEVTVEDAVRDKYKRDASVFEVKPSVVVFPKSVEDIQMVVNIASDAKKTIKDLSVTVRAAGTCMSGGSLTNSILIVILSLDEIKSVTTTHAVVEPGVYFRNLERELNKQGLIYPPYPSSKRLCAMGGVVNNNAGGEKSLQFGKAEDFIEKLKVILRDGQEYEFGPIDKATLLKKMHQKDLEGELYTKVYDLLEKNEDVIKESKVNVSKNSTGYNIWRVWDGHTFDMTKLFVGSQGTLGITTEITTRVIKKKKHRGMVVAYMKNFDHLPEIVKRVLTHSPNSFETYDHYTLQLALKYWPGFSKILKLNIFQTWKAFLPEFIRIYIKGMPALVLIIEFEGDDFHQIHLQMKNVASELEEYSNLEVKLTHNEHERMKYWAVRRESFNLLRQRVKGMYASPFIDDTVVDIDKLPEFFPEVYKILDESKIKYTIAGHIGNGNFHIIPLMDLTDPLERAKIYSVGEKIFDVVLKYGGSLSGEHNDGMIRSYYLEKMYGPKVYGVFREIKNIFDPHGLFNPHKKFHADKDDMQQYLIKTYEEPIRKQAS